MKILKKDTYRGLQADKHNLGLLAEKHKRIETEIKEITAERDHLKTELNRIGTELVEASRKLKKFHRKHGSNGKFVKNND